MENPIAYSDPDLLYVMLGPRPEEFEQLLSGFLIENHIECIFKEYFEQEGHEFFALRFSNHSKEIIFKLGWEYGTFIQIRRFKQYCAENGISFPAQEIQI